MKFEVFRWEMDGLLNALREIRDLDPEKMPGGDTPSVRYARALGRAQGHAEFYAQWVERWMKEATP